MSWRAKRNCGPDSAHLFFPTTHAHAEAIDLCGTCPVQAECRAEGRAQHELGIWGGETETERARAGFPPDNSSSNYRRLRIAKVRELSAEGMSIHQIAAEMGMSARNVQRFLTGR